MRRFGTFYLTMALMLIFTLSSLALSQKIIRRMEGGPGSKKGMRMKVEAGDVFLLPELAGMIVKQDGKLVVADVMEVSSRPEKYKSVDLKQDDEIQMVEGKPVKACKDISAVYENTKIGASFRLGVKRGEQMMIVSIEKGDPATLPKIKRMIVNDDGAGPAGGGVNRIVTLPAAGLGLTSKENVITVAEILDTPSPSVAAAHIAKGDKVTGINGKKVASMEEFTDIIGAIPTGTKVELQIVHKGKEVTVDFVRGGGSKKIIKD